MDKAKQSLKQSCFSFACQQNDSLTAANGTYVDSSTTDDIT